MNEVYSVECIRCGNQVQRYFTHYPYVSLLQNCSCGLWMQFSSVEYSSNDDRILHNSEWMDLNGALVVEREQEV